MGEVLAWLLVVAGVALLLTFLYLVRRALTAGPGPWWPIQLMAVHAGGSVALGAGLWELSK